MNGAASLWQEAKAADGRTYYYHTQTKATQWTKPAEMMGAAEVASSTRKMCTETDGITSAPLLGKNTLMTVASIGTIPQPIKLHGRCPRNSEVPCHHQFRLPYLLRLRKGPRPLHMFVLSSVLVNLFPVATTSSMSTAHATPTVIMIAIASSLSSGALP